MTSYANGHTLPTVHFTTAASQPGPQTPSVAGSNGSNGGHFNNGFTAVGLHASGSPNSNGASPQNSMGHHGQPLPIQTMRPIQAVQPVQAVQVCMHSIEQQICCWLHMDIMGLMSLMVLMGQMGQMGLASPMDPMGFTSLMGLQCTVVGGGDKPPWPSEQIEEYLSFLGSFWVYFEQKSVFKHFKNMNNPL